tara:strand:- start:36 stop:254 length:219 start_codon:yes stop_codon:yes gene_type:complete
MNDNNIKIWNITFDVDGDLYVLKEKEYYSKMVEKIIGFLQDNVAIDDIKLIDDFDVREILGHEGFNIEFREE